METELDLVDPDPITHEFTCIRAAQPIGDIFLAAIPFKILIRISHFDVRRVLQEERDVERYLGIQRPLEDIRVRSLSEYVNYKDASFPTSVILAMEEEYATFIVLRTFSTKLTCVRKIIGPTSGIIQSGIVEKNVIISISINASPKSRREHL